MSRYREPEVISRSRHDDLEIPNSDLEFLTSYLEIPWQDDYLEIPTYYLEIGVQRAASPWRTLGIRSCRTFCSDLA